jgi:hypothetical protein
MFSAFRLSKTFQEPFSAYELGVGNPFFKDKAAEA